MNQLYQILGGFRANPMSNNLAAVAQIKQMIAGQNPSAVFSQLMRTNPNFARFVQENQGRTPDEIARAYGIDTDALKQIIG